MDFGFFEFFHRFSFLARARNPVPRAGFQEMKNGEKTEIHFLLDRNPVCVRSGLNGDFFHLSLLRSF